MKKTEGVNARIVIENERTSLMLQISIWLTSHIFVRISELHEDVLLDVKFTSHCRACARFSVTESEWHQAVEKLDSQGCLNVDSDVRLVWFLFRNSSSMTARRHWSRVHGVIGLRLSGFRLGISNRPTRRAIVMRAKHHEFSPLHFEYPTTSELHTHTEVSGAWPSSQGLFPLTNLKSDKGPSQELDPPQIALACRMIDLLYLVLIDAWISY